MSESVYKTSKHRTALLEILRATKTHPTAAWLYERLKERFPDLSQGTVYRNLSILAELGLVRVLRSGKTFDRFDADMTPHDHMVCERCGRVDDAGISATPAGEQEAARATGYLVTSRRLDYYGICPDCQRSGDR